jgi:hypothetical protein
VVPAGGQPASSAAAACAVKAVAKTQTRRRIARSASVSSA